MDTPRERYLLRLTLELTLVFGILGLWTMRQAADVDRLVDEPRSVLPELDQSDPIVVAERFPTDVSRLGFWDAAHIFEKNPDDRAYEAATTPRDDFFLGGSFSSIDGDERSFILSRPMGCDGGEVGYDRTYIIHGDLWIHSHDALSFRLRAPDARATFLVYGDIHFRDDFVVDGAPVTFVARKDLTGAGGNIFLEDPDYFTLSRVDGHLYAESDIHIGELSGSLHVRGGLAAEGQVIRPD